MRRASRVGGLVVVLGGLLAACASPDGPAAKPATGDGPAAPPGTHLTITVASTRQATPKTFTLTCGPTGGTLPTAGDACAFVARTPVEALAPVPGQVACTMIYGGPQTATVQGTWRGKPVEAKFARDNGCEVARWEKVKPLLGAPP